MRAPRSTSPGPIWLSRSNMRRRPRSRPTRPGGPALRLSHRRRAPGIGRLSRTPVSQSVYRSLAEPCPVGGTDPQSIAYARIAGHLRRECHRVGVHPRHPSVRPLLRATRDRNGQATDRNAPSGGSASGRTVEYSSSAVSRASLRTARRRRPRGRVQGARRHRGQQQVLSRGPRRAPRVRDWR